MDAREELRILAEQVRHHEKAYRAGKAEITDGAFDELFDRYVALADELGVPEAERLDHAPGADHTDGFVQVEHRVPMLSLEKLTPNRKDSKGASMPLGEQLAQWWERRREDLELSANAVLPVYIEPKIDGISVSLLYERGILVRAVTRGDGKRGDDITRQVRQARAVPLELGAASKAGSFEVRGELYWPRAAFEAHNETLRRHGEEEIANPRNGTAGRA
jgi:DNA ligase (NAD+)